MAIDVRFFKKQKYDELTVEVIVDVTKKYMNVSKYKRVLTPVILESVYLYVNEIRINEHADEVFVITEFFNSLACERKFPMFTCSCGIFGCGGFYIDVYHKKESVIWCTEQSSNKKHIFSRENIRFVAEELIDKLTELNDVRKENGLQINYDIQAFQSELEIFLNHTKR
ncbi:hypothetical protein [Paenibacillus harenae]|uniref:Uncharacterized protein n=1 Tax=Paenibacillus harenae TaxID=306543 RepID=A0ABT9U5S8_PAEHA|nr:hypothetical protein [Paenibacillus harenae]MDQ0114040.1 hypothetical protein [Paenibacillus harenae]